LQHTPVLPANGPEILDWRAIPTAIGSLYCRVADRREGLQGPGLAERRGNPARACKCLPHWFGRVSPLILEINLDRRGPLP
jgi:hypothetical protein